MKEQAEKYLRNLNLDILTQEEVDQWYDDMIQCQPVSEIILPDWEEFSGYLRKEFYIRGDEDFGELRVAYFFPEGTIETDEPTLSIEEE